MNHDDRITPKDPAEKPNRNSEGAENIHSYPTAKQAERRKKYRQKNSKIKLAIEILWKRASAPFIRDEFAKFLLGIFIFLATALYAYFAYLQWGATRQSAEAATNAVNAARDAMKLSRDQFRQEQRPYIWLTNNLGGGPQFVRAPAAKPTDDGYAVWDWHVTNYGKAPAYDIRFDHIMEIGPNADKKGHQFKMRKKAAPLPPNKDDFTTSLSRTRISQEEFGRLLNNDDSIAIFGRFTYTDSYGGHYETGFCLSHLRTGAIEYCSDGNYIK